MSGLGLPYQALSFLSVLSCSKWVCMHVCMYVCMYVHVYVCMYIYICKYVCMHVCMYVFICMYNVYLYMYVYMYACMYVSMYVCMSICMYVCMYVWMYVCILRSIEVSEAWFQISRHLCFFTVRGLQPLAQHPTWRTMVSLLVWIIPFDLSGLGDSSNSYATAGIALRVIWPRKPHHYVKVETPSGERW
jgi:hypothetical protein